VSVERGSFSSRQRPSCSFDRNLRSTGRRGLEYDGARQVPRTHHGVVRFFCSPRPDRFLQRTGKARLMER